MTRNCLKCNKTFESEGPGNRLCIACNNENSQLRYPRMLPDPNAAVSSFNASEMLILLPEKLKRQRRGTETEPESDP